MKTSHFLNVENEFKVFKGNCNIVTDLSVIQTNPLVRLSLISLQHSYIIQSCTSNLLWEAHLVYPVVGLIITPSNKNDLFFFLANSFKTDFCKNSVKCLNVLFKKANQVLHQSPLCIQVISTISVQLYLQIQPPPFSFRRDSK